MEFLNASANLDIFVLTLQIRCMEDFLTPLHHFSKMPSLTQALNPSWDNSTRVAACSKHH